MFKRKYSLNRTIPHLIWDRSFKATLSLPFGLITMLHFITRRQGACFACFSFAQGTASDGAPTVLFRSDPLTEEELKVRPAAESSTRCMSQRTPPPLLQHVRCPRQTRSLGSRVTVGAGCALRFPRCDEAVYIKSRNLTRGGCRFILNPPSYELTSRRRLGREIFQSGFVFLWQWVMRCTASDPVCCVIRRTRP